jgi:hypothetical protein
MIPTIVAITTIPTIVKTYITAKINSGEIWNYITAKYFFGEFLTANVLYGMIG